MEICRRLCDVLTLPLMLMQISGLWAPYKRLFPWMAFNITFSYNHKMHKNKRELFRNVASFANADGTLRLLEIGCGSGANFRFYPDGCTVICTDPNPHFQRYLRRSMDANAHLTYEEVAVISGENMEEFEDESVDVVVGTLVLCSVRNVPQVLREVRRVLRPVSLTVLYSRAMGTSLFETAEKVLGIYFSKSLLNVFWIKIILRKTTYFIKCVARQPARNVFPE